MRRTVFVDTAGWLALLNARDGFHTQAVQIAASLRKSKVRLVTTRFVLIEVADAFAVPPLRALSVGFIDGLQSSSAVLTVDVRPVSEELLTRGWSLYSRRSDKGWGLTDCTSFVVMQEQGIAEAFTSDQHFTQAGFQRLL